jgi:small GTP-binding protein
VTLNRILTQTQGELLLDERRVLAEVEKTLAASGATREDLETLAGSIRQLDELFLLVVVGEFNSGKSAFINALLGERVLEEGVTPTTSKIFLIRHGDEVARRVVDAAQEVLTHPVELLRELTIVDTPGTNALDRQHEAITDDFVPRSDLVVFVTSADRPFSESERAFLERIRGWGKKVVVVVNKIDIIPSEDEVRQISDYIHEHSRRLLHMQPPVFPVSARRAVEARGSDDSGLLEASRMPEVERFLVDTLDEGGRIRLKLANPLGVATSLVQTYLDAVDAQLESLSEDVQVLADIEQQLEAYAVDVDREFDLRLADIDNLLHVMEKRGLDFFDDRIRLKRIRDLLRSEELRAEFERQVVADTPQQIEHKVESMIDWLVTSDLKQWQAVVQRVSSRQGDHSGRIVGEVGAGFEADRAGMLDHVGGAAREGLKRFDKKVEARRVAEEVQRAVTNTALVEVGAVGLGATIALAIGGSTADVTGVVAASTVAVLGLLILPHRRRRAKMDLRNKVAAMRSQLLAALTEGFGGEAGRSRARILDTIAPYSRFVRSEGKRLEAQRHRFMTLGRQIEQLQARVESATDAQGGASSHQILAGESEDV